ncbi:MAG: recombinase family protein [Treponema sp.]|nr:recombinase family protein [Treponema sp.]
MNYGYIRVSTDTQTTENQKMAIEQWCIYNNKHVDAWSSETISGIKQPKDRKLGELLEKLQQGDELYVTELSRLGRSLTMIFNEIQLLIDKKVKLYAIKENFTLADDIQSKVLIFAFGLSAEIERQLISERTKQGLARAKANGKIIGHKKGFKLYNCKLRPYEEEIRQHIKSGGSIYAIAHKYNCKWQTAQRFVNECLNMEKPKTLQSKPKKHGHPSKAEIEYFNTHA